MAETPLTRDELVMAFWGHHWPLNDILIDHVYETYHAGPSAGLYTDQDAWEQTRKLALFFAEHHRLPVTLDEWMPGWTYPE